ncbi:hypothetical protein FSP39_022276 [Pinctada imbricata]|uniref:Peroxidase n=1 Tax=Pinctada imbricata TaxID=66713 RepID=A0AA88YVZ6_PINIB|nr:hypothetical protein FSP39_022276 [Pinctada imbricata]
MHLLFVREHQRIVKELKTKQPTWSDNILYLEARKIVGALMQQITYGEYLPLVLTDDVRNNNGLKLLDDGFSTDYDPKVDPTIRNEFAVGVFRFGHSQIPDGLGHLLHDFNTIQEDTPLEDLFLDPKLLVTNGGSKVVDLARFIITEEAQKVDRFFESSIRNTLFGITDLTSLNIQRGRDHGVAPYIEYRRYCGLSVPTNFDELTDHPESTRQVLKDAYNDEIEDIDLFVAGVSEIPMSDSTFLGPTFSCLLSEQFRALKVGDRFWYEREGPGGFTEGK